MSRKKYFYKNRENLKRVYDIFRNTQFGRRLSLPIWDIDNYINFKKLPLVDPRYVNFDELFVPAEGLWNFVTSGVSGKIKSAYRDIGTIVGYPKYMDLDLRSNGAVFLHSKRREGESYYETHDVNHKRMYPNAIFAEYKNADQLLMYAQKGTILFIIEYPLMVEWICYQLEKAIKNKEILPERLIKKKVYLELSGEPINEEQLKCVVHRLTKIFQCEVEHFVTYGSNEIGHIGTYIPSLHGCKVVYEIIPSLFVEEVNGEIIVTPFRTDGTILFRYRMGDKGELFFVRDRPFVRVLGKSKDDGILYIAGAQIDIPEVASKVEKVVANKPVGVECIKTGSAHKGICKLNFKIHLPKHVDAPLRNKISSSIKQYVMDSAVLSVENHLGIVEIKVQYSTSPIKKRWFIFNGKGGLTT